MIVTVSKRWIHRILLAFFGLMVITCLCWVLPGFTVHPSPKSPLSELKTAESVWKQQHMTNYRMTVPFGSFSFIGSFYFTVKNNRVTKIENTNTIYPNEIPSSPETNPRWYSGFSSFLPNSIENYTVDQLFDFAAEKIKDEPIPPVIAWCGAVDDNWIKERYKATYDTKKGFLTSLRFTDCVEYEWGVGLMCPVISDCRAGFSISDLQPLQ